MNSRRKKQGFAINIIDKIKKIIFISSLCDHIIHVLRIFVVNTSKPFQKIFKTEPLKALLIRFGELLRLSKLKSVAKTGDPAGVDKASLMDG